MTSSFAKTFLQRTTARTKALLADTAGLPSSVPAKNQDIFPLPRQAGIHYAFIPADIPRPPQRRIRGGKSSNKCCVQRPSIGGDNIGGYIDGMKVDLRGSRTPSVYTLRPAGGYCDHDQHHVCTTKCKEVNIGNFSVPACKGSDPY